MVNSIKKHRIFNPNLPVDQNWRNADALNFAWFHYADEEEKDRYRNGNEGTAKAVQQGMEFDLRDRLADGECMAFGIQVQSNPLSGAKQIPAHFFAASSVRVDWDKDEIFGLGCHFADVRICLSANPISEAIAPVESPAPTAKRGGGRPNQYVKAKVIIAELLSNPALEDMRAAKLIELFNAAYLQRYSFPEIPIAPVSVRSLQDYLKRYQRELAETRKN